MIRVYLALLVGVVAVSFAATFIRLAEAPSLVIATYRLGLASLLLSPLAWWRSRAHLASLKRRDLLLASGAGVFLALHFALWITSLEYTSVASSVVLVTTNPLFVGVASHFLTGDKLTGQRVMGVLIALVGAATIGYGGFALGWRSLLGDLLALLGAMAIAAYFFIGRGLRGRVSLLAYIWVVYSAAALALLLVTLAAGYSLRGYSPQTYLMFLLLALIPQLLGHSSVNWALRYLPAMLVTVAILGEPVGATLLAYLFLGEAPTALEIGGAALVLLGVYVAFRARPQHGVYEAPKREKG